MDRGATFPGRVHRYAEPGVRISSFEPEGGPAELQLVVTPRRAGSTFEQLAELEACYRSALGALELSPDTAVFRRFFLSDAANQERVLRSSGLRAGECEGPVAESLVEQPPLPECHVALWAWHVRPAKGALAKVALPGGIRADDGQGVRLWLTDSLCFDPVGGPDTKTQTRSAFEALARILAEQGARLDPDVVRTWIFVEDVDLHYGEMVAERRELFARVGLEPTTHYIASTGIAGRRAPAERIVQLEAYVVPGLQPSTCRFLSAPEYLGRTDAYGVTFERAVQFVHGAGTQTLVSGTASIDPEGRVLHPGDVVRQLERALANVAALLREGGCSLHDLTMMIVYLRDAADRPRVEPVLRGWFPELPWVLVRAAVCRPEWLVEVECMAMRPVGLDGVL